MTVHPWLSDSAQWTPVAHQTLIVRPTLNPTHTVTVPFIGELGKQAE